MATDAVRSRRATPGQRSGVVARLSTETKHALKTTEFWAMVAIIACILIASWIVGQGDGNGNADVDAFPAQRAWLYVAIVGVGYMVSRGLAKAGSREPYWADESDLPGGRNDD
jgi:TRAP-type C4-dicarboxylate transport system permease small subunit